MKKSLLIAATTLLSLSAQAGSMTCKVGVLTASKGGLMPADSIEMTTAIIENAADAEKCRTQKALGQALTLCAGAEDFIGGYSAVLMVNLDKAESNVSSVSTATFGTAKRSQELLRIDHNSEYLRNVQIALEEANLHAPHKYENDSLQIDKSVEAAVKRGILAERQALLFSIEDCQIER